MKSALILSLALLAPSAFAATPAISLSDNGEQVSIALSGLEAPKDAKPIAAGDRIEIALLHAPDHNLGLSTTDETIKKVEVLDDGHPRLSIRLRHSKKVTEALAEKSVLVIEGMNLQVRIPRDPSAPSASVQPSTNGPAAKDGNTNSAAPTANNVASKANGTPSPSSTAGAPASEVTPPTANGSARDAYAPEASASSAKAKAEAKTETARPLLLDPPAKALLEPIPSADEAHPPYLMIGGLIVLAGLIFLAAKKRAASKLSDPDAPPRPEINVVAQRALGGKAKLILVNAGPRELLLSVTDRGARLIAQWKPETFEGRKNAAQKSHLSAKTRALIDQELRSPAGLGRAIDDLELPIEAPTPNEAPSPSLNGLMKLREKSGIHRLPPREALDESSEWAKQLLNAMKKGAQQ